jgi:alanyl-tRNA synthetase
MKTNELREKYLAFFERKGHRRCDSDVLVPTWDPTVLFTPAGMNQFKDHFLGKIKLDFVRATSCQKCLRAGDIENVGRTAYHHTFFEMLGNFSFGDYFKRDAIHWAWEFLTDKSWLGMDPDRLTVSVFLEDDEAADIWTKEVGLAPNRVARMNEYENFWPAGAPTDGPDGVCGPCSEIFFHPDRGDEVEIWNLVFTQFNREGPPPGNLTQLPTRNIDTGMGLERAAASLQGVETNFHIDILRPIVEAAAEVCGVPYRYDSDEGRRCRRITDHIRACTMCVHENVYPGSHKEKYVVRRLLRRAVLDGHQMGIREPFLYKLVPAVVEQMKTPYPEMADSVYRVAEVIQNEESNFFGTIDAGLARVDKIFRAMESANRRQVRGGEAAELYQTYGVPPEMFETMALDKGLTFDWDGFKQAMQEHGEASGKIAHGVMSASGPLDEIKQQLGRCEFRGYEETSTEASVKFIVADGALQKTWNPSGEEASAIVVLDQTPFYAESGGQVGDTGTIEGDGFVFQVIDTQKDSDLILHHGYLESGTIGTGASAQANVDQRRRQAIRRAHSATHILHYALQKHVGTHAQQQGSKVDDDWLRFDFTNMAPVAAEKLAAIQQDVDECIKRSSTIQSETLPLAEAKAAGAMMLFGEKYPDPVRMVTVGQYSKELCGGTHLENTMEIKRFEILSEEGVSAGTRRVVAITGTRATEHAEKTVAELQNVADVLNVAPQDVVAGIGALLQHIRDLKKRLSGGNVSTQIDVPPSGRGEANAIGYDRAKAALRQVAQALNIPIFECHQRLQSLLQEQAKLQSQLAQLKKAGDVSADTLLESAEDIAGTTVVVSEIPGGNTNLLRQLIDGIRKKSESSAVLLAAGQGKEKLILVAGVSRDLVSKGVSAGHWVREVAPVVGGGGGGKPDMAQAGGKQPDKLPEALDKAREVIRRMLSA